MCSKQFESVLSGTALSVPHKHTLELHIIPTLMGKKSPDKLYRYPQEASENVAGDQLQVSVLV